MNKIKNFVLFLEAKNNKQKKTKLKLEDDYNIYQIEYSVLDDEGDQIEVSYSGTYIEIDDNTKYKHDVSNLGDNTMKTFIEEEIEEDLRNNLNFKFINFV